MWKIITKFAHSIRVKSMNFTAEQIAAYLQGEIEGNPQATASSFSKIEEGKPGTLTFLANPVYTHFIYSTEASIVLVRKDFIPEQPIAATLIRVDDPYSCLSQLLDLSQKMQENKQGIESPSYISESAQIPDDIYIGAFAYIGKNVVIGKRVKIYPQTYIGDNVVIGDDCTIYPGVKIYHGCHIGQRCILHAGVVIGSDGFGFAPQKDGSYKKIPQIGIVTLEDDVEIGANTVVDRATMGSTLIHKGVKLDNLIQIAHNVEVGEHTVMAAQAGVAGSSKVGSHCMIGGQVGIAGHRHVGNRVMVGAQTGIPNDVKDDSEVMGYPAVSRKDFARQAIYVKRLPELNDLVKRLSKEIDELKQQCGKK